MVFLALGLVAVFVVVWIAWRRPGAGVGAASSALLGVAAASDSGDEWRRAMLAEHDAIEDPAARRRFARGALVAIIRSPATGGGGELSVVALFASAVLAIAATALVRYPELRSQESWLVYLAGFLFGVLCYVVAWLLVRHVGAPSDRLVGVATALPAVGLGWAVGALSGPVPGLLVLCTVGLPAAAVAIDRVVRKDHAAPLAASLTCVLATGLGFFCGLVAQTLASNGGTPTLSLLAQAHREGYRSFAAWSVGDALGGACFMLAIVLVVGGVVATALGVAASRRPPTGTLGA
jgi:hypothetical protein